MIPLIVILVLLVLLFIAETYFFRYTFLRGDKVPWSNLDDERILFDRSFFERPDREALEITSRDGLRLKGLPALTLPCRFEILGRGVISDIPDPVFPIRRQMLDAPDTPVFRARIVLREGKRHQIKRMLEAVGCTCLYLRRERFGPLTLDPALAPGEYRPLTEKELRQLREAAALSDAYPV